MTDLVFFDKEGNYLNFQYDTELDLYTGNLIFHENSSDTFKTIGLYLFQRIPAFEFTNPYLKLEKFQLFNEFGFNFTNGLYQEQPITKIEATNNDPKFKSKWIYGEQFDRKYPLGSEIRFNQSIFEFTNTTKTYTVVSSRKGAVMIISSLNNNTFNNTYGSLIGLTSSYENKTISSINSIGIHNYTGTSSTTLSEWSEPYFWSNLYNGRKLNVLGTEFNDNVVTIKGYTMPDKVYWEYSLTASSFSQSSDLWMEVIMKTDLPSIYQGSLTVQPDRLLFTSEVPSILKPGTSFRIVSNINTEIYTIGNIAYFDRENSLRYYSMDDQVIWNNTIYQCVQSYTQSLSSGITPDDTTYWTNNIDYLPLGVSMSYEALASTQLFLNTNTFYFETKAASLTASNKNEITLASCADQWSDELKNFNIDLKFEDNKLKASLIYASEYATVNFYKDFKGSASNLISATAVTFEKVVEVEENLTHEMNKNFSRNHFYSVVFTDIDEFGILIIINGIQYQHEVQWTYDGPEPDLPNTVDKTLRAWIDSFYFTLLRLGIVAELDYTESAHPYIYADTINFYTIFPNVAFQFDIRVGTTANFYIKHSLIEFLEIGSVLNLTINGRQYLTQYGSQSIAVPEKLRLWVEDHQDTLDDYGILTNNYNNSLSIDIKEQDRRVVYSVFIGKNPLPGENSFKITEFFLGNMGSLITSNSIIIATSSSSGSQFFDINGASAGELSFATGMITSINNSVYPFNNQDYNLIEVKTDRLVFSYQGPFWGSTYSVIDDPYISVYYDTGFTQSLSSDTAGISGLTLWQEVAISPTKGFDAYRNWVSTVINIPTDTQAISDITDVVYAPLVKKMFIFGSNIKVYDAEDTSYLETIVIPGITTPVRAILSSFDNQLYCVTLDKIYRINVTTYQIEAEISLGFTAASKSDLDVALNTINGDLYISCTSATSVKRVVSGSTASTTLYSSSATYKMAYDNKKNHLYVITASDLLRQFDCDTNLQIDQYTIPGITAKNSIAFHMNEEAVWIMGNSLNVVEDSTITNLSTITAGTNNFMLFDNISNTVILSRNTKISSHYNFSTEYDISYANYGNLLMSQYDENLFMGAQNTAAIFIIDSKTGQQIGSITGLSGNVSRIVYNAARNSMIAIVSNTQVLEIKTNTYVFYRYGPQESYQNVFDPRGFKYGTVSDNFTEPESLWLKTRDYIRKPRMNFIGDGQAKFIWKWKNDDVSDIFLYDFTGEQLEKTGAYKYIGEIPLDKVYLNRNPNRDLTKISSPEYQQTIFNEIIYDIDYINSSYNLSFRPEPLECFIGYKSEDEGIHTSILQLNLREDISFTITPSPINGNVISFTNVADESGVYGRIDLATSSTDNFLTDSIGKNRGLKVGQNLMMTFQDISNSKNKYTSYNQGIKVKIKEVYDRLIIVEFDDLIFDPDENVVIHNEITTLISTTFTILDKEVARIIINGQTEIEDIRYKTNLGNEGKLIAADDVYIFKTYDINEQGIDWKFLNNKRKEMLLTKDQIYPYIGSYKAIINAINYFGYNDLEFYEYYRNVDFESPDYFKLVKIEIPDIFDNTVPGWKENDWIKWTLPNPKFEDTNLFNLTYRITDREGNNVLLYSLAEVITKLSGLKRWLESNVIPITHKIYDITGRADFVQTNTITHKNYAIKSYSIKQSMSPVDFNLNEAYLMPVNSGSSVYNCVLDFTMLTKDYQPDYFTVKVKTYKTYPEWQPFKTYSRGNIVSYFQENWESTKDNNRLNNPRKYLDTETWSGNIDYQFGEIVEYNRHYYIYSATQSSFSLTASNPFVDQINGVGNWIDITEWRRLDYVPVQNWREFRTGTHSFNFTVDTNIDPYIVAEVISENGYGLTWTSKKAYEIRGILNIDMPLEDMDTPGPIKIWERIKRDEVTVEQKPIEYITIWEAITPECI